MPKLQFCFLDKGLSDEERLILAPKRKSELASGFDLASAKKEDVVLKPGDTELIPTGIAIALAPGFEAQVRSRSGLSLNHGIIVLNSPGTIDADYRGEIKVILTNLGKQTFTISFGMRIAQMVIAPVILCEATRVDELPWSLRGEGGFGSTGLGI